MPGVSLLRKVTFHTYNVTKKSLLFHPSIMKSQSAGMLLTSLREPDFQRPPPFPYKEKRYSLLDSLFDRVVWRFNENSKIIVVDGPPASGKSQVAKDIAEAYDLEYMPPVNLDRFYINDYGFDNRKANEKLPFSMTSFDIHEFLQNPHDPRAVRMHLLIYNMKLMDYVKALAHVLNTGQGVVMDSSVYSDIVFSSTFTKCGFYPKNFDLYMRHCYLAIFDDLLKPHAVVYLDQSVDATLKCIKDRNLPGEENSPVYKKDVLKLLERNHKDYLESISSHAELLVYNWDDERDSKVIIEDLETVNLDDYKKNDSKMRDWRTEHFEHIWIERRALFTNNKVYFNHWAFIMDTCCPEVHIDGHDLFAADDVMKTMPGMEFAKGYNYLQGDPYPYFK